MAPTRQQSGGGFAAFATSAHPDTMAVRTSFSLVASFGATAEQIGGERFAMAVFREKIRAGKPDSSGFGETSGAGSRGGAGSRAMETGSPLSIADDHLDAVPVPADDPRLIIARDGLAGRLGRVGWEHE